MRYVKPHYYDQFVCIAGKCPDTCCAGWQIVIDDDSLERYAGVTGAFGNRLMNSINWEEGTFCQYNRRCSFLSEENLCDLYRELGPGALCDTCRMYPRHVEEYEGLRELSLSLSCPEAAGMILSCTETVRFESWETDEEEEFEDFDFLLFSQLEDARDVILEILQNRRLDLRVRMRRGGTLAAEFQRYLTEGRLFEVDALLERFRAENRKETVEWYVAQAEDAAVRFEKRKAELSLLYDLERLRPEWTKILKKAGYRLYEGGVWQYTAVCREFDRTVGYDSEHREQWQLWGEQLMVFFVYTYFCGAEYDERIASQMSLAIFSTCWIQELLMLAWLENGKCLTFPMAVETAYRYAREVEHSDQNLDLLEDALEDWFSADGNVM